MSDETERGNITIDGEIDAGWTSYYGDEDGETVGPERTVEGEVTTEGEPQIHTDKGEQGTNGYPSADAITDIRKRLVAGESASEVADDYEVSANTVKRAARGEVYADLEVKVPPVRYNNTEAAWEYISEEATDDEDSNNEGGWPPDGDTIDEIRQRLVNGETTAQVAEDYPISDAAIYKLASGSSYSDRDTEFPPIESVGWSQNAKWQFVTDEDSDEETADEGATEGEETANETDDDGVQSPVGKPGSISKNDVRSTAADIPAQKKERGIGDGDGLVDKQTGAFMLLFVAALAYLIRRWRAEL